MMQEIQQCSQLCYHNQLVQDLYISGHMYNSITTLKVVSRGSAHA